MYHKNKGYKREIDRTIIFFTSGLAAGAGFAGAATWTSTGSSRRGSSNPDDQEETPDSSLYGDIALGPRSIPESELGKPKSILQHQIRPLTPTVVLKRTISHTQVSILPRVPSVLETLQ